LKPHAKRLLLLDSKEQVISARFLHQDEHITIGHIVEFKDLSVLVGECIGSSVPALEDFCMHLVLRSPIAPKALWTL
jgi:hypothetical protein